MHSLSTHRASMDPNDALPTKYMPAGSKGYCRPPVQTHSAGVWDGRFFFIITILSCGHVRSIKIVYTLPFS